MRCFYCTHGLIRYSCLSKGSFGDLCQKAELGGDKITTIYDEFYDVEVAG